MLGKALLSVLAVFSVRALVKGSLACNAVKFLAPLRQVSVRPPA